MFFRGEENFLKKLFFPVPHLSKTLKRGGYFFAVIIALDRRTHNVRTAPNIVFVFSYIFIFFFFS